MQPGNPGSNIATEVSPKIDAVFSGHSHQHYNCVVKDPAGNPRPFIEGLAFGRELSVVDLKIDRRTRDVIRGETKADNKIVTRTVTPDPAIQAVIDLAKTKSGPDREQAVRHHQRGHHPWSPWRHSRCRSASSSPTRSSRPPRPTARSPR